MRAYLNKKLEHVSKLIDPKDASAHAEVELSKLTEHHQAGEIYRAKINLHIAGANLRAEAQGEDILPAIDRVQDEIERELVSFKNKRISLVRRGARQMKSLLRRLYPF